MTAQIDKPAHDYHPRELHLSPTTLESLDCPRRFYFKNWLGLQPKSMRPDLVFGSAIHAGIAYFYSYRKEQAHQQVLANALKEFAKVWDAGNLEGNDKKNLATGLLTLTNYIETYRYDSAEYLPDMIETPVWMEIQDVMFGGVLDRVQVLGSVNILHDTKTWSSFPNMFWLGWENSFQLTSYHILGTYTLGSIDHIMVDAIKCPGVEIKENETFVRKGYSRTEFQLQNWKYEFEEKVDRIRRAIAIEERGDSQDADAFYRCFPTDSKRCTDYGGCPYLTLCKHGLNKAQIQMNFSLPESHESS